MTKLTRRQLSRKGFGSPQWRAFLESGLDIIDALLIEDFDYPNCVDYGDYTKLEPMLREAWPVHREHILYRWSFDHPFTRPPTWWFIDAPLHGERRLLRGRQMPSASRLPRWLQTVKEGYFDTSPWESERKYLERHTLLMPREQELAALERQREFCKR